MALAAKGLSEAAPPQHQVFISFRGSDVRYNIFSFLKEALKKKDINVVTDEDAPRGKPIDENILKLIRDSRIAVVIFSENYPESTWCLDELVEIEKQMDLKRLDPCPVFFEVETCHVKLQAGKSTFDYNLLRLEQEERRKARQISKKAWEDAEERFDGWRRALISVASRLGLTYKKHSNQATFVSEIVDKVKAMLDNVSSSEVVPQYQVYISARGQKIRHKFFSFLRAALQKSGINVSSDDDDDITKIESREELDQYFVKIREARIALVIISKHHKSSAWCLEEMLEITKRSEMSLLQIIPILYDVNPNEIVPDEYFDLKENGIEEYKEYKEALVTLTSFVSAQHKSDAAFVEHILKWTKKMLATIHMSELETGLKNCELRRNL